jgi:hypothetical protein
VVQVVESDATRGVSVPLGNARPFRFPSVLLQPLGHLSGFRINDLPAVDSLYYRTPVSTSSCSPIAVGFSELRAAMSQSSSELCQTLECRPIT